MIRASGAVNATAARVTYGKISAANVRGALRPVTLELVSAARELGGQVVVNDVDLYNGPNEGITEVEYHAGKRRIPFRDDAVSAPPQRDRLRADVDALVAHPPVRRDSRYA